MNVAQLKNTDHDSKTSLKPVRYIAAVGTNPKSCRKIKLLLKGTNFYCVVDCFKNSAELEKNESFYLPDCVIVEVRSVTSLLFLGKRIQRIKELIPGIKVIVYYNMLKRYRLLNRKDSMYAGVYCVDDMLKQLRTFELVLKK